jgi:hypothetical protein
MRESRARAPKRHKQERNIFGCDVLVKASEPICCVSAGQFRGRHFDQKIILQPVLALNPHSPDEL